MRFVSFPLLMLLTIGVSAQTEIVYPYNPDVDESGTIGVADILEPLSIFGSAFSPGSILIDGQPLEEFLLNLQVSVDSISVQWMPGTEVGQMLYWDGMQWSLVPSGQEGQGLFVRDGIPQWLLPSTGCLDEAACNFSSDAIVDDHSCTYPDECGVCGGSGPVNDCGCVPIPDGACDCEGNVLDALYVCGGGCLADEDQDGICDDVDDCFGTLDECGICNGPGAIHPCGCQGIAPGTCDCAGTPDTDGDGICDDADPCVGSFDAIGDCNGNCQLDADGDGICDDDGGDDCFGSYDQCGVCNGPGPVEECGCLPLPEGACDCAGNLPDSLGICPDYLEDTDGDGLYDTLGDPCLDGEPLTYQGKEYAVLALGDRCWFRTNLASSAYRNGDAIPQVISDITWSETTDGAWCQYFHDPSNGQEYGYLFNGYAALDDRGLCPQYWSVASEADWQSLFEAVGGAAVAASALKESGNSHWPSGNPATNSSGFTALGAGERGYSDFYGPTPEFIGLDSTGYWWTSTPNNPGPFAQSGVSIRMFGLDPQAYALFSDLNRGQSIRCIRDSARFGCTDIGFLEFDEVANINDGSCETPAIIGCMNPNYVEYDPTANVDYGNCISLIGCAPGDLLTYQGDSYSLVTIGAQCWMAEDLRVQAFANGDGILNIPDPVEWASVGSQGLPALSEYLDSGVNPTGRTLYNGYAVQDERGLCPSGWHLADDTTWQILEAHLGLAEEYLACQSDFGDCGGSGGYYRGDDIDLSGFFRAACDAHVGFNALDGYRDNSGYFYYYAAYWTPTQEGILGSREVDSWCFGGVYRYASGYFPPAGDGRSVRCVRD